MSTPWSRVDWDAAGRCTRLADWDGLREAFAVPADPAWDELVDPLAATLTTAAEQAAADERVVALFFEVDPPQTGVFLCLDYLPELDWPADFERWVDGPALPARDCDEITASAWALVAFGLALERLGPLPYPVAIGVHDCPVLYAPLPPGVMAPEDRPRTVIPVVEPDGWYRLDPVDWGHGDAGFDEAGEAWLRTAHGWRLHGGPPPPSPPALVLTRGRFEDCIQTLGPPYPVSERLAAGLADHVATIPICVRDRRTGVELPYAICRPRHRRDEAVRRGDLEGVSVLDVRYRSWRREGLAIVAGTVLDDLVARGCLVGLRAVPVTLPHE